MQECFVYRNIRYATAERFAPAELTTFHDAALGAPRGPIAPQNPSRFDVLLGPPAPLEQSEDCQVLSVFTPRLTGHRPVMIWFHGGASITGGGELPWYDGTLLAAEQDVVVVTVTARLGALGFLSLKESEGPSPATTDHLAAVEWVHRYIDQFGGDPENITVFGQSAGGFAIEVMLRWGVGTHVKGAIIQSGFLSQQSIHYQRAQALEQAAAFRTVLGEDPRFSSVPDLLSAQTEFARRLGAVEIWAPIRPEAERPVEIPVIAGWTQHDTLPFILLQNGITAPRPEDFDAFADQMQRTNTTEVVVGNHRILDEAVAHGQQAWHYEFGWEILESGWGSPHCIELPFLLGSREAWAAAPMLAGANWDSLQQRGTHLRAAWASFARDRDPGGQWIAYNPTTQATTLLDGLDNTALLPSTR